MQVNVRRFGFQRASGAAPAPAALPASGALRLEAYGPCGSVLLIDVTGPDGIREQLRAVLARYGAALAAPGAIGYLFQPVGFILCAAGSESRALERAALHGGAEEVIRHRNGWVEVLADPAELEGLLRQLRQRGFAVERRGTTERSALGVVLEAEANARLVGLLDELAALDAVRNVYTNAEVPDTILAQL